MKTIWKGVLARGGRTAKEFDAEIVEVDGKFEIIQRVGVEVKRVSPPEVRSDYWLKTLVDVLKNQNRT